MFLIVLIFLILFFISFALFLNSNETLLPNHSFLRFCHKCLVKFPNDMYFMSFSKNKYLKEEYKEDADDGFAKGMGEFAKLFIAFKKLAWKIKGYKMKIMAKFILEIGSTAMGTDNPMMSN